MLMLLLLPLCSAQLCSHPCDLSAASPNCTLTDQTLLCNSSVTFSALDHLKLDNVKVFCYISPTSEEPCQIQLYAQEIVLVNSFLLGSSVEVNSTDAFFTNSILSANGTAPYAPLKACLDKGGGYGGRGGGSCKFTCSGTTYGSPYMPMDYGSPGAFLYSSYQEWISSGGGKVIIDVSNLRLSGGEVSAGGNLPLNNSYVGTSGVMSVGDYVAGGSGGSILIVTDSYAADGDLVVTAAGGDGGVSSYGGGGGRVAIYGSGPTVRVIISGGSTNTYINCPMGGAGTFYEDSSNTLIVDNNGFNTENVTPLPANLTVNLQVLNQGAASPDFVENSLNFASISVEYALIMEAVDRLNDTTPSFLNVSSPVIKFGNGAAIGKYSVAWIVINSESMTVGDSMNFGAYLFFGRLLNVSAVHLIINGDIRGFADTNMILIYSQHVKILSAGELHADRIGLIVDGGSFYLHGLIRNVHNTCTPPSNFNSSSMYQCLDLDTLDFRMPNATELLQGNFTIFIFATQSLEVSNSGSISGARIGLCSKEVMIEGTVMSTGLGCESNHGVGKGRYLSEECTGSGGGYGGNGGAAIYANGTVCAANRGGKTYGLQNETWYEGSGGGSFESYGGAGGGFIAISGLNFINITQGKVMANGEDSPFTVETRGAGGGAGGSIWLTTQFLKGNFASIFSDGGKGMGQGGGGGGGRILFQFIGVQVGPDSSYQYNYENCSDGWQQSKVSVQGGGFSNQLSSQQVGENGTLTSLQCTPGSFGPFCRPCDIGYYKTGWDYADACSNCSNKPAVGIYTHEHWGTSDCPYRCPSFYADARINPHCYSPFERFLNYFGGKAIGIYLGSVATLTALGVLAHTFTAKFVLKRTVPMQVKTYQDKTMSSASAELTREDLPFHHKRCYLLGNNSYTCPWSLSLIPISSIEDDVRADEFADFADRVNTLMYWPWWQHAVLKVLLVLHHPIGNWWLLYQRRRRYVSLRAFVQKYQEILWKVDLREPGNRLKVSASRCYTNAALEFMNPAKDIEEWDERPELPLSIFCNGDGSFFCPHRLNRSDLMVQFLADSLDVDHLEQYYQFIDEFNTVSRNFSFSTAPPDSSQAEMRSLTAVAKDYNKQIFNERGFEVVPCLFQTLLSVHSGRYIFTRYSFNFTNDMLDAGAKHFNYTDTTRRYCYKVGLIVTEYEKKFQDSEVEPFVKDAQHWQPLVLDAEMGATLVNSGLSLAHLPETTPPSKCRLGWLLSKQAHGRPWIVLIGLLVCMFTDLVASAMIVLVLVSDQHWIGILVFMIVVPFASTAGPMLGLIMLFRPASIRSFISFELASLLNVFSTLIFFISVKEYFGWFLFIGLDFLVKVAVVQLAVLHLAHAETYIAPNSDKRQSSMEAELLSSASFNLNNM